MYEQPKSNKQETSDKLKLSNIQKISISRKMFERMPHQRRYTYDKHTKLLKIIREMFKIHETLLLHTRIH